MLTLYTFLTNIIKKYPVRIFIMFIVWLLFSIHLNLEGILLKKIINILGDTSEIWPSSLVFYTSWYLGSFIFMIGFFRYWEYSTFCILLPDLKTFIRTSLTKQILNKPIQYFYTYSSGTLTSLVDQMTESSFKIIDTISRFVFYFLLSFIGIYTMYKIYPLFGLLVGIWILSYLLIVIILNSKITQKLILTEENKNKFRNRFSNVLENIFVVKLFMKEKDENNNFIAITDNIKESEKSFCIFYFIIYSVYILLFLIIFIIGIIAAINGIYAKTLTIGDLAFLVNNILTLFNILFELGSKYSELLQEIQKTHNFISQLYDKRFILSNDHLTRNKNLELTTRGCNIEFRDVSFFYKEISGDILNNLSFNVKHSQSVGIVGESGSGKTTLINLILQFITPQKGSILINNQDIQFINLENLRKNISIVSQESLIFNRSLKENIGYGIPNYTDEMIIEAAKNAEIHDFIAGLPMGYQTIIGDEGFKLSGGQKQRLCIARAFLKNAPILILDEATSALDSETEYRIQQNLEKLSKDKTTIIIAHRLSTLVHCDTIIVLQKGTILEQGTHKELIHNAGLYKNLWDKQTTGN